MTLARIRELAAEHGLTIHNGHDSVEGYTKFRDLEIGTGATYEALSAMRDDLRAEGVTWAIFRNVNNPDHPDRGKLYLEIPSFWCE